MINTFQRETVEFQPVSLAANGSPIQDGVEFSIVLDGRRPDTWVPAVHLSGKLGFMVQGRAPGAYHVWARITANPETPVIDCGIFRVI
jgi:hypothetical protein